MSCLKSDFRNDINVLPEMEAAGGDSREVVSSRNPSKDIDSVNFEPKPTAKRPPATRVTITPSTPRRHSTATTSTQFPDTELPPSNLGELFPGSSDEGTSLPNNEKNECGASLSMYVQSAL